MVFDSSKPAEGILAKLLNDVCRENFTALLSTISFGHDFVDGDGTKQTGVHAEGSCVIYAGTTAPTKQENNGAIFVPADVNRRLWLDTADGDNVLLKALTGLPGTWTPVGDYIGMLDDDLMGEDEFGVGDGSETVTASQQSIKAYVDTQALDLAGVNEMDGTLKMGESEEEGKTNLISFVKDPEDNQDAATKNYVTENKMQTLFKVGFYNGDDNSQDIENLGFKPNFVMVWGYNNNQGVFLKTDDMGATEAKQMSNGNIYTESITAFIDDGFTVFDGGGSPGNNNGDNLNAADGRKYYYIAAKFGIIEVE